MLYFGFEIDTFERLADELEDEGRQHYDSRRKILFYLADELLRLSPLFIALETFYQGDEDVDIEKAYKTALEEGKARHG